MSTVNVINFVGFCLIMWFCVVFKTRKITKLSVKILVIFILYLFKYYLCEA